VSKSTFGNLPLRATSTVFGQTTRVKLNDLLEVPILPRVRAIAHFVKKNVVSPKSLLSNNFCEKASL